MAVHRPPRPKALLDAIEAETPARFSGQVWRVVTDGFDPLRPSRAGGRWDDGSFDVLYTSAARDGALAESWFHAAKGQPIIPSKVSKRLFQIEAELHRVLDLSSNGKLASLGVNMAAYARLSYIQRVEEISGTSADRRGRFLSRVSGRDSAVGPLAGLQCGDYDRARSSYTARDRR
jgi:hypothetical protein